MNKPGRKKIPKAAKRVIFGCTVDPKTKRRIKKIAKGRQTNIGRVLDETFAKEDAK